MSKIPPSPTAPQSVSCMSTSEGSPHEDKNCFFSCWGNIVVSVFLTSASVGYGGSLLVLDLKYGNGNTGENRGVNQDVAIEYNVK